MEASAFVSAHGTAHDQVRSGDEVAQIKQVGADLEIRVILLNFVRQQAYSMTCPFQALVRANYADVIPHETAQFMPIMRYDDFLIGIGHPAFIPAGQRL